MAKKATRLDPRYVASYDPAAVWRAWFGDWDLGGWTGRTSAGFRDAVKDELRSVAAPGERIDYKKIVIVRK